MDHGLRERLVDRHVHGRVDAERIARLVILGAEADPFAIKGDERLFKRFGE